MSDELLGDMTEDELNAILESDDPDQIEAMLEGKASKDKPAEVVDDEDEDAGTPTDKATEVPDIKTGEESAAPGAKETEEAETEETGPYIEGKSGVSKIPYSVLENTRSERNALRSQLAEVQEKLSAAESQSQKVSGYLEKNGIDLSALERGETLDESQMAALEELDPAIAKLARITIGVYEQQKALTEQLESKAVGVSPLELAIRENADLKTWRDKDADRWDTACQYDDLLKQDPAFKNSSLEERFAEAVLRTKKLFGDDSPQNTPSPKPQRESAEQIAAAKIAAASKQSVPRSLTDVGATPSTERTLAEVVGDLDGDALIDRIEKMSPEQIDQMLADAQYS